MRGSEPTVFDLEFGWSYDAVTGIWRSEVGDSALHRAVWKRTGQLLVEYIGPYISHETRKEYGRAWTRRAGYATIENLTRFVIQILTPGRLWINAPHLRRADGSVYQCDCGAQLSTDDFGRELERHRRDAQCDKKAELQRIPGHTVAVYAVSAEVGKVIV